MIKHQKQHFDDDDSNVNNMMKATTTPTLQKKYCRNERRKWYERKPTPHLGCYIQC